MSANLDRFSCGYTPKAAVEVGDCKACDGTMYDYEQTTCPACDAKVHRDCLRECWVCKTKGCGDCIVHQDMNLDYVCEICMSNRKYATDLIINNFGVPGYWHSETSEDEDHVILEFISGDNPKVQVLIEKRQKE